MILPGTTIELPDKLAPLLVPIESLAQDPANPRRTKDIHHLVGLMRRFGYTDPVVVNPDGMLLAGHQRMAACLQAGATEIPAITADLGSVEGTAFNIAHNRSNEVVAGWDEDALAGLMATLQEEDAALVQALGWSGDELETMLGFDGVSPVDAPDRVLNEPAALKTVRHTLTEEQVSIVMAAVERAKAKGHGEDVTGMNSNTNGNAITVICEAYT